MKNIRWRPVIGHEDSYEVSDAGMVRSLDRVLHRKDADYHLSGRLLKPRMCGGAKGYLSVSIAGKNRPIHQLVLETFIGPRPSGFEACHNDGDRLNNRVGNLRWDTPKANMLDKITHGASRLFDRHPSVKLTVAEVTEIRQRLASGESQASLAREFGISDPTIIAIKRNRSWRTEHLAIAAKNWNKRAAKP